MSKRLMMFTRPEPSFVIESFQSYQLNSNHNCSYSTIHMPCRKIAVLILKIHRIQLQNLCINLSFNLSQKILKGISIEKTTFLSTMRMEITVKKQFRICLKILH